MNTRKLFYIIIMLLVSVTVSAQSNGIRRGSGTANRKPSTAATRRINGSQSALPSNRNRGIRGHGSPDESRLSDKRGTRMSQEQRQSNSQQVYDFAEKQPSFPGGLEAMNNWLSQNVHYPSKAKAEGVQGRVLVSFIVETDGSLSNIQVVRSVDPTLDIEAVRTIKAMPKWSPGLMNGQAVRVKFSLPIVFKF